METFINRNGLKLEYSVTDGAIPFVFLHGLGGSTPMSLKEVGDACNLTKERIRQIEKHALVRMQHPARLARLEAYVA